jgi:hypothetical protein
MFKPASISVASLASFAVVASLSAGCSVESGAEDDALSASSRSYVTVRHDQRKCASPKCGGYFVRDVNRSTAERYVSSLDFSHAPDLDDEAKGQVTGAPDGELVLRGKLGPLDAKSGTRAFLVYEAYRGMPGRGAAAGDVFFDVTKNDPPHECFAAPCNNLVAHRLNSTKTTSYTRTDADVGGFVDAAWLEHRVEDDSAIVAGTIANGDVQAAGPEQVLTASQVFVRLPERLGPCPALAIPNCAASGKVASFVRTPDRCVTFHACVTPGVCALYLPACEDGYSLVSWNGGPHGCEQHACEPTWLEPQN